MTMQVTKGEFDRRVKLLEQKVQQSANKLMNDYKEFVERINSITSDNADFNRYAAIVDRINSCFDTNGQFDGSHIAPLSIETSALSVGQRSQALNIDGLKFEVKDYKSSDSAYQYGILNITDESGLSTGNGTLTHYTLFNKLDENNNVVGVVADFIIPRKVININNTTTTGNKNDLWYIYVELPCNKQDKIYLYDDSTTESKTGNIFISQEQIKVDDIYTSEHKYLCVLLGTISKVFSKTIGTEPNVVTTYYRIVDLNYGLTTINGRLITTGRIEGSAQNSAYFDLDEGEIGGTIKFTANNTSALAELGYATKIDIDNIEIGGTNLLLNSSFESTLNNWDKVSDPSITTIDNYNCCKIQCALNTSKYVYQSILERFENWQDIYTVSGWVKLTNHSAGTTNHYMQPYFDGTKKSDSSWMGAQYLRCTVNGNTYDNPNMTNVFASLNGLGWKYFTIQVKFNYEPSTMRFFVYCRDFTGTLYFRNIKLEKGNKATSWSPAPEDMEEGGWVTRSENLYLKSSSTTPSPSSQQKPELSGTSINYRNWVKSIEALGISQGNTTDFLIYTCTITYKIKDSAVKDFYCTDVIYDQTLTTNLVAMQGSTTIAGGLVLTSKIVCGSGSNTSGMMGISNSPYAFWAGGNTLSDSLPVWIKRNGSAKFGDLNIANNGMLSFSDSSFYLKKVEFEINKTLQESLFDLNNTTPGTTISLIQEETGKLVYTLNIDAYLFRDVEHTDNWVNFKTQVNVTQYKNGSQDNTGITLTVEVEQFGAGTDDKRTSKASLINQSQSTSVMSVNNKLFIKANTSYTFTIKVEQGSGNVNSLKINNGAVTIVNRDYINENFIEKGFNIYGNGWSMYKDSAAIICFINEGNIIFKKAILNRNKDTGFSVSESTIV